MKRRFVNNTTDYLGHWIRPRRFEIVSYITDGIEKLKLPTNNIQLRLVLALCNVFRCFVPSFACMPAPENRKHLKHHLKTFGVLTAEEDTALKDLKNRLNSSSVIALPYADGPFTRIDFRAPQTDESKSLLNGI